MKCIKENKKDGLYLRVNDKEAKLLVESGDWVYTNKQAYKRYLNNLKSKGPTGDFNMGYREPRKISSSKLSKYTESQRGSQQRRKNRFAGKILTSMELSKLTIAQRKAYLNSPTYKNYLVQLKERKAAIKAHIKRKENKEFNKYWEDKFKARKQK